MSPGPLPLIALALAATQLGSCVAAAALVPLAAGGTVAGKTVAGRKAEGRAETSGTQAAPKVIVGTVGKDSVATGPAQSPPMTERPSDAPLPSASAEVSAATAILPPSAAPEQAVGDGYAALTAFVLAAAQNARPGMPRTSALLDQRSLASLPVMADCNDQRGAVLIDLDIGADAFNLDDPPSPAPGLAERLRTIRGTGTAVVWIASLPASEARRLGTVLKATGLDPLGIDPVMLLGPRETRRQQILERAGDDWCVMAIAGDRKADFDEVFDYLRNPDGPVALALEQHIGAGWFLVPPPIK